MFRHRSSGAKNQEQKFIDGISKTHIGKLRERKGQKRRNTVGKR